MWNLSLRASVMRSVQQDLTSKPLKSVSMNGSHTKIYFEFQDGANILPKTLSLTDRELTYGDEKWELQGTDVTIDVENILVESTSSENDELCEEVVNSELQITERHCPSYKYMKITIPIINGGEDNVIDDIELFYIGESTIFVPNYSLRTYFLKYDKDEGSEILVNRKSTTQSEIASIGTIHESNEIYPGDQLKIDLSPKENYVLDEYSIEGYEEFKNGDTIVVDRNVVVKARSHVPEYQLKISQGTGTTITVNRSFSIKGGKGILHQGDPIYQGDQLIISVSANTAAYNTPVLKVNSGAFTSGGVYTVSNPIDNELLISSSATVKEYKLTKTQGDGTTLTIQRTASPIGKGILGDLENNAKIYYNDTLKVTVSAKTGYKDAKIVAGGKDLNSGGVKTITGNLAISSSASKITYNVTYNANGGTDAPDAQTKYYGTDLQLSSSKPTRRGYTFVNWNTKSNGSGTSYIAGGKYTDNAKVTLYAQWNKADTIKPEITCVDPTSIHRGSITFSRNTNFSYTDNGGSDNIKSVEYKTIDVTSWTSFPGSIKTTSSYVYLKVTDYSDNYITKYCYTGVDNVAPLTPTLDIEKTKSYSGIKDASCERNVGDSTEDNVCTIIVSSYNFEFDFSYYDDGNGIYYCEYQEVNNSCAAIQYQVEKVYDSHHQLFVTRKAPYPQRFSSVKLSEDQFREITLVDYLGNESKKLKITIQRG